MSTDHIDSESWQCRGCGAPRIGNRPPDDLCPGCIVQAMTADRPMDTDDVDPETGEEVDG